MAWYGSHLAVSPDHGAEQFPRPSSAVDANHSKDLEEAETAKSRCGKDLSTRSKAQNDDAGTDHHHIYTTKQQQHIKSINETINKRVIERIT